MFADYRLAFSVLLLFSCPIACTDARQGTDGKSPLATESKSPICFGEDCVEVLATNVRSEKVCPDGKVSLAWNRRDNAYLIVCDCDCTSHDNTAWIGKQDVDGRVADWKTIFPGMLTPPSVFSGSLSPVIRDIYVSHPMCAAADRRKLEASTFVTLLKRPSGSESFPYCFEPLYISVKNDQFEMDLPSGPLSKTNLDFYGGAATSETKSALDGLVMQKASR